MSEPIPEKVGKYPIIRQLGRGATSVVYLARDPFANRDVAIKVVRSQSPGDTDLRRRFHKVFLNEAALVGKLFHPHILAIYDAVFTLLPTPETHGHHRAATLLALEAAAALPEDRRPLLLAADPCAATAPTELYRAIPGEPLTRTVGEKPAFVFNRNATFGYRDALNYQIVVNWFIAEHKSQGLFQTDSGKHQLEQFWLFEASGRDADSRVRDLAAQLKPAAHQVAAR